MINKRYNILWPNVVYSRNIRLVYHFMSVYFIILLFSRQVYKRTRDHLKNAKKKKKVFKRIQHLFMIKPLNKLGIEETYLSIIKFVYNRSTANIIINHAKLKVFLLRSGIRQEFLFSPLSLNIISRSPG